MPTSSTPYLLSTLEQPTALKTFLVSSPCDSFCAAALVPGADDNELRVAAVLLTHHKRWTTPFIKVAIVKCATGSVPEYYWYCIVTSRNYAYRIIVRVQYCTVHEKSVACLYCVLCYSELRRDSMVYMVYGFWCCKKRSMWPIFWWCEVRWRRCCVSQDHHTLTFGVISLHNKESQS